MARTVLTSSSDHFDPDLIDLLDEVRLIRPRSLVMGIARPGATT